MEDITVTRTQNSSEALKIEVERHGVRPVFEHIHHPLFSGISHFGLSFHLGVLSMEVQRLHLTCDTFPRQLP